MDPREIALLVSVFGNALLMGTILGIYLAKRVEGDSPEDGGSVADAGGSVVEQSKDPDDDYEFDTEIIGFKVKRG